MLFPLSPPLWARIGAADSSAHGSEATPGQESGAAFFAAKQPVGSGGGGGTDKAYPPTKQSGANGVEGKLEGGDSGGGGSGIVGNNLFKGGAMFRGMFKAGAVPGQSTADNAEESSNPDADRSGPKGTAEAGKGEVTNDLAAKFRISLSRFGGSKEAKKEGVDGAGEGAAAVTPPGVDNDSSTRDSGFGSLFRKVQTRARL